jgi:hypothetical protein
MTYTGTSSGQGLDEFGYNTGQLDPTQDPNAVRGVGGPELDWFTGTDAPPDGGQLANAEAAGGGVNPIGVVIPVAQAPVAVVLSLPVGCTIQEGSTVDLGTLTASQLFEQDIVPGTIFATDPGAVQTNTSYTLPAPGTGTYAAGSWGAFLYQEGYAATTGSAGVGQFSDSGISGNHSACNVPTVAFVSSTTSGEAFALKSFFAQFEAHVWGTYANGSQNWPAPGGQAPQQAQGIIAGGLFWPNDSTAHLASNVAVTPGAVGYANTSDAVLSTRGPNPDLAKFAGFSAQATTTTCHDSVGNNDCPAHQILYAQVQNNLGNASPVFADPVSNAGGTAPAGNCETTANVPSERGAPKFEFDSWVGILASDPDVGDHVTGLPQQPYPICANTYALAWKHYGNTPLFGNTTNAHSIAAAVKDLFTYVTGATTGQTAINSDYYDALPPNIQAKARIAVAQIAF